MSESKWHLLYILVAYILYYLIKQKSVLVTITPYAFPLQMHEYKFWGYDSIQTETTHTQYKFDLTHLYNLSYLAHLAIWENNVLNVDSYNAQNSKLCRSLLTCKGRTP